MHAFILISVIVRYVYSHIGLNVYGSWMQSIDRRMKRRGRKKKNLKWRCRGLVRSKVIGSVNLSHVANLNGSADAFLKLGTYSGIIECASAV